MVLTVATDHCSTWPLDYRMLCINRIALKHTCAYWQNHSSNESLVLETGYRAKTTAKFDQMNPGSGSSSQLIFKMIMAWRLKQLRFKGSYSHLNHLTPLLLNVCMCFPWRVPLVVQLYNQPGVTHQPFQHEFLCSCHSNSAQLRKSWKKWCLTAGFIVATRVVDELFKSNPLQQIFKRSSENVMVRFLWTS